MSRRPTSERERGTYLGSHQIAALVGANPYSSPADVYAEIALGAPRAKQNAAMTRGLIIEHGLIHHASERLGLIDRDAYYVDDETPYLGGSIDGITADGQTIVEVTTCNESTREAWGPSEVGSPSPLKQVQAQYFLGLTGARACEVLCLDISNSELLRYVIEPDPAQIATLFATARAFWTQHIEPRVPPLAIDGWGRSEHLDLIWPGPPAGEVVEVPASDDLIRWRCDECARAICICPSDHTGANR
jgi:putative phage-type endonuclease